MLQDPLCTTQNASSNYSQALHLHSVSTSDANTNGTWAKPGSRYPWVSIISLDRSGIVSIRPQFSLKDASIWNFLIVFRIIWISTTMAQFMKAFPVLWIKRTLPPACVISLLFRELGLLPNDRQVTLLKTSEPHCQLFTLNCIKPVKPKAFSLSAVWKWGQLPV